MPRMQAKGQHVNVVRADTATSLHVVAPKRETVEVVAEMPQIFSASRRPAWHRT
jgi:hypothetical protein